MIQVLKGEAPIRDRCLLVMSLEPWKQLDCLEPCLEPCLWPWKQLDSVNSAVSLFPRSPLFHRK